MITKKDITAGKIVMISANILKVLTMGKVMFWVLSNLN